jgi:SEC-C motif domain protein
MRSRYSAYALGDLDYLWRTWHPRTRPHTLTRSDEVWTGLQILDVAAGQRGDEEGVVEFRAHFRRAAGVRDGLLHERSTFAVRAGRWFYLDGEQLE